MSSLNTVELKAFVPARDFELSKQFYQDIGFTLASDTNGIAYLHHQNVSFLLQNFYVAHRREYSVSAQQGLRSSGRLKSASPLSFTLGVSMEDLLK